MITGLLSGVVAATLAMPVLWFSGAVASLSRSVAQGSSPWTMAVAYLAVMAAAGAVYGRVFMRSANDRCGGWMFGLGYGFLLWMLGPVTILQWVTGRPAVVGGAAQGLFAAHLCFGLVLGLCFPYVHQLVQRRTWRRVDQAGQG